MPTTTRRAGRIVPGVVMVMVAGAASGREGGGAGRAPSDTVRDATVEGELGGRLDEYLGRLADRGMAGAVLVARNGGVALAKGYGPADRERGIPVTIDTVFSIGSVTKQFTAAAILKLEMEGKLRVEDRIGKYLEGVPEDKAAITLHHLLTHSSGLVSYLGNSDFEEVSREQIIERAWRSKLLWPPGGGYRYSNVGYSLLAAVVEKLTGQSYDAYLGEHLFRPAGMDKTGYRLPGWRPVELAHGYDGDRDRGTMLDRNLAPDGPYWNLRGNGGLQSTIRDLYRWHRALEGETVLSGPEKAKYFHPHVREGEGAPSSYAYGWAVWTTPRGTRLIRHNGGDLEIFNADFLRYVDEGVVIIVVTSTREFKAEFFADDLARIVFGGDGVLPPEVARVDPARLAARAGTYRLPGGGRLVVAAGPDHLEVAPEGQDAFDAVSGARPAGASSRDLTDLTAGLIEKGSRGDYGAVHAVLGGEITLDEARAMARESWDAMRERHGAFRRFEVLGTSARGEGSGETLARLEFDRGVVYRQYVWRDGVLDGIRPLETAPGVRFYPESESTFSSFDVRSHRTVRLKVEGPDDGGEAALVLETAAGPVRARRSRD
jgi:CubicO group peptidase (beta-lactamase class C family)